MALFDYSFRLEKFNNMKVFLNVLLNLLSNWGDVVRDTNKSEENGQVFMRHSLREFFVWIETYSMVIYGFIFAFEPPELERARSITVFSVSQSA